jgi:hypothetical protein
MANGKFPGRVATGLGRAVGALTGNAPMRSAMPPARPSNLVRPSTRPDSTIAQSPSVGTTQGTSSNKLALSTYITKVGSTDEIYDGSRLWAKITVTLETAGPVAIGTRANLLPVLGGNGVLLDTDVPMTITISKGDKLYIAANAVSRVKIQIEAFPWLEQLAGTVHDIMTRVGLGGLLR